MIDIRGEICRIISAMLDAPSDCGIFQTTKCYDELEALVERTLAAQRTALLYCYEKLQPMQPFEEWVASVGSAPPKS